MEILLIFGRNDVIMEAVIVTEAITQINHLQYVVQSFVQSKVSGVSISNTRGYEKAKGFLSPKLKEDYVADFVLFTPWLLNLGITNGHKDKFFTGAGNPTTALSNLGKNHAIAFCLELFDYTTANGDYEKAKPTDKEKEFAEKIIKALERHRGFDLATIVANR